MGVSSSSLLDESKCNYIRGRAEAELKNFSPHYKRQYTVAFLAQLQDEVEQHRAAQTQLLKHKEPREASEVVYTDTLLHFEDGKKWKERFVVFRANYSLEIHDSQETFTKGSPARHTLLPTAGTVLTSEEQYSTLVDKAFPDLNSCKEESSAPVVVAPGPYPVFLHLPYRRDAYFSFQQEDKQIRFISGLSDCIRHQNHDCLQQATCEAQAFLKAIHFYRQEKGHYESWQMLVGSDSQVLGNLVMEELLPSLQTELLPKLKGKKAERKRVWFSTVEATYALVREQLLEGLHSLKEECKEAAKQQEALIRSDMDQITNSRTFLETKLQGLVSEPCSKFCSESVSPYLASILEELMVPVSSGFQAVRQRLESGLGQICRDVAPGAAPEQIDKALEDLAHGQLEDCYQHVNGLKEQLQELRNRFKFSNTTLLVHTTQSHMQQLMENAVYTFETLLQSAMKDKPDKLASIMEKAKLRVIKQYDYDSSTVRKKIFQDALVDITLPAIRRSLAPSCKTELQNYEQYIFADYSNFIQVENVYEDILLNILNTEVNKVVKEAASSKKHNLFVDSTELQCISQSSLSDSRTPPRSAPSSPARAPPATSKPEENPEPSVVAATVVGNGCLESQLASSEKTASLSEPASETATSASQPGATETASDVASSPTAGESEGETEAVTTAMASVCLEDPAPTAASEEESEKNQNEEVQHSDSPEKDAQTCSDVAEAGSPVLKLAEESESEKNRSEEARHSDSPEKDAPTCSDTAEAGSLVLKLEEEVQHSDVPADTEKDTPTCPDISEAAFHPKPEKDSQTSSCDTADVAEAPVSDAAMDESTAETSTSEKANGIPVTPNLPAGGDDSPADHSGSEVPISEPDEPLDSVKAIRDLVVEIVEVEEAVTPCPDSGDAQ